MCSYAVGWSCFCSCVFCSIPFASLERFVKHALRTARGSFGRDVKAESEPPVFDVHTAVDSSKSTPGCCVLARELFFRERYASPR